MAMYRYHLQDHSKLLRYNLAIHLFKGVKKIFGFRIDIKTHYDFKIQLFLPIRKPISDREHYFCMYVVQGITLMTMET